MTGVRAPFFSSDGRWIGFFSELDEGQTTGAIREGDLRKISVAGGPPIRICQILGGSRGASWGPDNSIVFATNDLKTGLLRVSADGGEPATLTTPDTGSGELDHHYPSLLPEGRGILFTIVSPAGAELRSQVAVLDSKTGRYKTLVRNAAQATYATGGHIVYRVEGSLWAAPFDLKTLSISGEAVPVVTDVAGVSAANFAVSSTGTLAYVSRPNTGAPRLLVWATRSGVATDIGAPPRIYNFPRLAPDASRVIVRINDREAALWSWDFTRRSFTRLTPGGTYSHVVWSPDGRSIYYASGGAQAGSSSLFHGPSDLIGSAQALTDEHSFQIPNDISPDGKYFLYQQQPSVEQAYDLMLLPLDGRHQPQPLLATPGDERNAQISPDGRWLVYEGNELRRSEIYVRPFPNVAAAQFQLSTQGGRTPTWSRNGREIFYVDGASLMSVPVQTAPAFHAGSPTRLFEDRSLLLDARTFSSGAHRTYEVSPDGQRFLMMKFSDASAGASRDGSIVVVRNWSDELRRLVTSDRSDSRK